MIDADALLADTKKQVVSLIDDLREVSAAEPEAAAHVAAEYQRAHAAGRTAFGQAEWAEGLYAQVAVAWVLGCVFVRFCEDNDLIDDPLLGGPGIRGQIALDHRAAHLQANPSHDDRHWLREVFGRLRALPATGDIFGAHNPVWADGLLPSADGARKLREQLTRVDPETGELRHDFTDPTWDTRFLGDLYQDLSEHAKKTYALLQTPVFVEEFILDRTLDPAIATFGLADTTIIDPTCGSGHFLLGAFARLFGRWRDMEPATNPRELARRSLDAVGGIDLNPFAASIARFRLLLAALRAGGDRHLGNAPAYEIHVAVGDSLLHGDPPGHLPGMHAPGEEEALVAAHGYESEDVAEVRALLARHWSAVVGNPPYITVKDPALNAAYRSRFETCSGKYSLGVPFTERFWQLARNNSHPERAGFVGMITANSFMKREMGRQLIQKWVPVNDVTHVVDTSGAYIPGHGTPTVILFGRNRPPVNETLRAVMGIQGEPARPVVAEKGLVWTSIVSLIDEPGSQSEFVSVVDLERSRLEKHPWSIGGGGASELKEYLDSFVTVRLGSVVESIGPPAVPGTDDALLADEAALKRNGVEYWKPVVSGDAVRDFSVMGALAGVFLYDSEIVPLGIESVPPAEMRWLWRNRAVLSSYMMFGKDKRERGLGWYEWGYLIPDRLRSPLAITYAEITTHNHFVLDRGGKVFNRTAPVIKLQPAATEDQYLELLGVLNSSVACFWVRQSCHDKGNGGYGGGIASEEWERFFVRDATKLKQFPLPASLPLSTSRRLERLANDWMASSPSAICRDGVPTAVRLAEAKDRATGARTAMIATQERLDWECYRLYGLVDEDVTGELEEPPLELGQRAFEIVLARKIAAGEEVSSWFERHRSIAITDLPADWTPEYRKLVEQRIELIDSNPRIGLMERPENKRRWASKPWEEQVQIALKSWLLHRLETPQYWPQPAGLTTIARLTAEARADEDFVAVSKLYTHRDDADLAALVSELVRGESVPHLAAMRYSDTGLRKHAEWLNTWEQQRREDHGEDVGTIPVPPKYGKSDFASSAWEHRGKLDVPKERFISYPGAEREADSSAVTGWAGWNHLDRARALAAWYLQARRDGRDVAHLTPLLAGLAELVPWLKQWYDEPSADPALDRPGTQIAALVETELRSLSLTAEDLAAWRPEKKKAVRKRKAPQ